MKDKKLGLCSIILLTINSIIGLGIFLSPGGIVRQVGTFAPYIYLIASILALILGLNFALCAKYVVKAGGSYAYTKVAFGEKIGFYIGITNAFSSCISFGVMSSAVIISIYKIFNIDTSFSNITKGYILFMALLMIINLMGTKFLNIISNISTIGKTLALLITIIAGIFISSKIGNNMNLIDEYVVNGEKLIKELDIRTLVSAVIIALYAYTGFEVVATGTNDMKNPRRNLIIAIPVALVIIALIYCGIILVALFVNPIELAVSNSPLVLAEIFNEYFNGYLSAIITIGAIVSMVGINIAYSFHTPRMFESMAREKHLPVFFGKRLKNGLPIYSIIITKIISIAISMAFLYKMDNIIVISSISKFTQYLLVPISLIIFYLGKNKEAVLETKRNFITDFILPLIALFITAFLLIEFDYVKEFSTIKNGVYVLNYWGIIAMLLCFVILPIILYLYKKKSLKNRDYAH